jgi:hypothetical protein
MTTVTSTSPIASLQAVFERRAPGAVRTAGAVAAATVDQATRPVLPVRPDVAALLPAGGLPLGSTVAVDGSSRLLLIMLAAATEAGSWAAVVGMPDLGLLAAHECDVVLERLAVVPSPGSHWAVVVDALLDGLDIVVVGAGVAVRGPVGQPTARSLISRARNRGKVLIPFGHGDGWPAADLRVSATDHRHGGLGDGHGYLVEHEVEVTIRGRGAASRPRQARLVLHSAPSTSSLAADRRMPEQQLPERARLRARAG